MTKRRQITAKSKKKIGKKTKNTKKNAGKTKASSKKTSKKKKIHKKAANESPKMLESRQRKSRNSKRHLEQINEQQFIIDYVSIFQFKLCLIDYWEDSNNKVDLKNNFEKGRIASTRVTRPGTFNFKFCDAATMSECRIQIDEELFLSCSCNSWNNKCRDLGIICVHLYYLMKYILKYPVLEIEDNQLQNKLLFFKNLGKIKLDYDDEMVIEEVAGNQCMLCYKDWFTKRNNNWQILKLIKPFYYSEIHPDLKVHARRMRIVNKKEDGSFCSFCKLPTHKICAQVWAQKSRYKSCFFCKRGNFIFKKENNNCQEEDQNSTCMICWEDLKKNAVHWGITNYEESVFCPDCAKPVHFKCALEWLEKSAKKTCLFCRSSNFSFYHD